jgi:anti-sigma factor RsiW
MNPRQVNIESIELYLKGAMPPEESQAFEARIQSDPKLAEEVEAYRVIFSGFEGLAGEELRDKMSSWSAEWRQSDMEETMLIEAFLKDELHPDLKQSVEERMAKDTSFASKVSQYKTVVTGLGGMADEEFKQTLAGWENKEVIQLDPAQNNSKGKLRTLYRRLAVAASFLLIISVGVKWYASANFNAGTIAATAYFRPETGGTMGNQEPQAALLVEQQFAKAHDFMETKDYESALESFDNVLLSLDIAGLSESRKNAIRDNAMYSKALALLAQDEDMEEVKSLLEELNATSADNYYKTKVSELKERLDSFWFRIR